MANLRQRDRLVVAADFSPLEYGGIEGVRSKVLELARALADTGVFIKVNSILRACGYSLIEEIHELGLRVFADLKIIDIPSTIEADGQMLAEVGPDIVTVMACAGVEGMQRLDEALPSTQVLGVTVLTSLDDVECENLFGCSSRAGVLRFARLAQAAGISGLILSPKECDVIEGRRREFSLELSTPGIRPGWMTVTGDDQKRVMTPSRAIMAGAERLVIGRPITRDPNPAEAVERILGEIRDGLDDRARNSS